jgi:hypothetical protein
VARATTSTTVNTTSSTNPLTLETLSVPAGTYLLTVKARVIRQNGGSTALTCSIRSGATILDDAAINPSSSGTVIVLHGYVTLAAAGNLDFRCYSGNTTGNAVSNRTFSAQQFTNLTVQ